MSFLPRDILGEDVMKHPDIGNITPLDLDTISEDITDQELESLICTYLSLPDEEGERVHYLNMLLEKAIFFLSDELLYDPKELGFLKRFRFESWSDVLDFLRATKGVKGKMRCSIVKAMLAFNDGSEEFNGRISTVREKTARVVNNKLTKPLQIIEESEDGTYIRGRVALENRIINFNIRQRAKSDISRVQKEIKDPDYHTVEHLSDNYGVTFEVENRDDIPFLMQYVAQVTFKKGIYEIKNKGMFSQEDIEKMTGLSPEFLAKMKKSIGKAKKAETAKEYRDIKLVTPLFKDDDTDNLSLEIKFTEQANRNEKGLQMQGVYGHFKKILQRIRLEQFIRPAYIDCVVDDFLYHLEEILEKNINRKDKDVYTYKKELFNDLKKEGFLPSDFNLNNQHIKANIDSYLRMGLCSYYKSLLRTTKANGKGRAVFTTSRGVSLSRLTDFWSTTLLPVD